MVVFVTDLLSAMGPLIGVSYAFFFQSQLRREIYNYQPLPGAPQNMVNPGDYRSVILVVYKMYTSILLRALT